MKIRPGRLIFWGAAALVVALIAWSFRPQPVPVDRVAVQRGTLRVTIDEEGMTRIRERYIVSAPVAGRLQRVDLEPGDPVAGRRTVLATFFPATPSLLDTRTRAAVTFGPALDQPMSVTRWSFQADSAGQFAQWQEPFTIEAGRTDVF